MSPGADLDRQRHARDGLVVRVAVVGLDEVHLEVTSTGGAAPAPSEAEGGDRGVREVVQRAVADLAAAAGQQAARFRNVDRVFFHAFQ